MKVEFSAKELYDRISNQVHNRFDRQTPMLLGETERTLFGFILKELLMKL